VSNAFLQQFCVILSTWQTPSAEEIGRVNYDEKRVHFGWNEIDVQSRKRAMRITEGEWNGSLDTL
jgi:hypothetical protein